MKRQQIAVSSIPNFTQEEISNQYTFLEGIGTLEAAAASADRSENGFVNLSLPMASEIGSLMDEESGNRFQADHGALLVNSVAWPFTESSTRYAQPSQN